jgi:putative transposase
VLDGYSRAIVHWEIREQMKERDVETIVQRAKEKHPDARPRIISDNGPQFVAREFKAFVRISGMTHVRTSPYYPQSNGKLERWHGSLKRECVRPGTPLCVEDARRLVAAYVEHYNGVRLHGAIGYITPADQLAGRAEGIHRERDRKLDAARERRCQRRASCHSPEAPAACATEQQRTASRGPGGGNEPPGRPNEKRLISENVTEGETHQPRD